MTSQPTSALHFEIFFFIFPHKVRYFPLVPLQSLSRLHEIFIHMNSINKPSSPYSSQLGSVNGKNNSKKGLKSGYLLFCLLLCLVFSANYACIGQFSHCRGTILHTTGSGRCLIWLSSQRVPSTVRRLQESCFVVSRPRGAHKLTSWQPGNRAHRKSGRKEQAGMRQYEAHASVSIQTLPERALVFPGHFLIQSG